MGTFRKTLKRHRTPGRIAQQALKLIPPMGWDLGVRMERKPVDTGTAGARECGMFPCITKPRPNAPHLLTGPLPEGDALLHGGGQGVGEFGCVGDEGIIPGGHGFVDARLQVSQVA